MCVRLCACARDGFLVQGLVPVGVRSVPIGNRTAVLLYRLLHALVASLEDVMKLQEFLYLVVDLLVGNVPALWPCSDDTLHGEDVCTCEG